VLLATSVIVVVPFLFLLGSRLGKDPTLVRSPLLGRPAPDFSLPRIGQPGTLRSAELAGKIYVLNFWSSWCVPCREETPTLEDFYQRWRNRGVELVGVLYGDTVKAAQEFRRQFGGTWPLADDPGGRTAIDYGVFGVPETFVVDEQGVIMAKLVGAIAPGTLDTVLTRLGDGAPIYEQNNRYRTAP
jgi:cytochrome c biogenesis protein CcmG/thiol:disulfide interchange protein DsbE